MGGDSVLIVAEPAQDARDVCPAVVYIVPVSPQVANLRHFVVVWLEDGVG